jgi:DNA-directed RNA polymerase specialized sigma subunit
MRASSPRPSTRDLYLAARARVGDNDAELELLERYNPFILKEVDSYVTGCEIIDAADMDVNALIDKLIFAAMIGVGKAVREFVGDDEALFAEFVRKRIKDTMQLTFEGEVELAVGRQLK